MVAERFLKGRVSSLQELLPYFSTFSGRLVAIESFVEKHLPKNAVAATSLIEIIVNSQNHLCAVHHPRALAICTAIREMAQPFIAPTQNSTPQELVAMIKLVKGPEDGGDVPPASMNKIIDIATSAKRFEKLDDILLVSRTLPHRKTANGLMLDFLKRVGITTAAEAEKLLELTNTEFEGSEELINEIIRQIVRKGPKDLNIATLLAKTEAFTPPLELTGLPISLLQSLMGPGDNLSSFLSGGMPAILAIPKSILGDGTEPQEKGLSDKIEEIMKREA
jgi:hypothetical protein